MLTRKIRCIFTCISEKNYMIDFVNMKITNIGTKITKIFRVVILSSELFSEYTYHWKWTNNENKPTINMINTVNNSPCIVEPISWIVNPSLIICYFDKLVYEINCFVTLFGLMCPDKQIIEIKMNNNNKLYRPFKDLRDSSEGKLIQRLMWHGTSCGYPHTNNPDKQTENNNDITEIICKNGFDIKTAKNGTYGNYIYASTHLSTSTDLRYAKLNTVTGYQAIIATYFLVGRCKKGHNGMIIDDTFETIVDNVQSPIIFATKPEYMYPAYIILFKSKIKHIF
jgi:hypothetical protein